MNHVARDDTGQRWQGSGGNYVAEIGLAADHLQSNLRNRYRNSHDVRIDAIR